MKAVVLRTPIEIETARSMVDVNITQDLTLTKQQTYYLMGVSAALQWVEREGGYNVERIARGASAKNQVNHED